LEESRTLDDTIVVISRKRWIMLWISGGHGGYTFVMNESARMRCVTSTDNFRPLDRMNWCRN
jgi:hypothetical protein